MRTRSSVLAECKHLVSIILRYWWVFALAVLVYAPSVVGSFVWDDEQFIYKNVDILRFDIAGIFSHNTVAGAGVVSGYYRPITSLSFAIDWLLAQGHPSWFHVVNVFWHLAAGAALAGLLTALQLPVLLPLTFFLLHPLQTEPVAYISCRGAPLSMFFGFLSMWLFVRFSQNTRRHFLIWVSLILFLLAVLSKESAVMVAGLLGLIMIVRGMKQKIWIAGYGGIALAGILLRLAVVGNYGGFVWEGVYGQNMWIRLLTFSRVFFEYLRLIVIPYPLHMERFVPLVISLQSPWPWIAFVMLFLFIVAGIKLDGAYKRQYWFGMLWFGLLLIPQSGVLIPAPALLTEHWLYGSLPGLGLALDALWRSWGHKRIDIGLIGIIGVWILIGFRQSFIWADPMRFYEYTIQYTQTARLHNNLGMHYMDAGRFKEAEHQYQSAVTLGSYPQIHYNLGNLFVSLGRIDDAVIQYRKALDIASDFVPAKEKLRILNESSTSGFR